MLTPNLYIKEKEITTVPIQTTASTVLAILPTKSGMAHQEVIINTTDELIEYFGEPSDYNYKEWFQVWNYLQYSSPVTVIRVTDIDTTGRSTNASFKIAENTLKTFVNKADLYNQEIGSETISDIELSSEFLQIFKKTVGNDENIAIGICSNLSSYDSEFSNEKILYRKNTSVVGGLPIIDESGSVTNYKPVLNNPIEKENIWYDVDKEREFYKEEIEPNPEINKYLNHGFKFNYKLMTDGFYYRQVFDETLQDPETGKCITFKQLFNSDLDIKFNEGYFLLAVFKYNSKTLVFNLVESYMMNYDIRKKVGDVSYAQVERVVNETSPNIWLSLNKDTDATDQQTITSLQTLNTNSDTILSTVIRNDNETKSMSINYEQNTVAMWNSFQSVFTKYSDPNYNSQIRYILPVVRYETIETITTQNLNFSSELANTRKNCLSVMSTWNESLLKAELTDTGKINNTIIPELGTSGRSSSVGFVNRNSYTVCYDNMKYQTDPINYRNRWIPIAGDCIGIIDSFDKSVNTYDIPAGYNTTRFKNVVKMMYDLKDSKLKDKLATNSINLITKDETGQWMLYDMLTNIAGNSIFGKINVRRMVIDIKGIIQRLTKNIFFGVNDASARADLLIRLNSEIRPIGGLDQYQIICDESNNTEDDLNNNRMNIDFLLVPKNYVRIINIRLNLSKNSIDQITEQEL